MQDLREFVIPRAAQVLDERQFPYSNIKMLASKRWAGDKAWVERGVFKREGAAPDSGVRCLHSSQQSAMPINRSAGRQYEFQGEKYTVEELTEDRYGGEFMMVLRSGS